MKTDLQRSKKTLPVVLAAAARKAALQEEADQTDKKIEENEQRTLREGILAAWGLCLLYRERARDCLQEVAASCARPTPPALRLLLGF